MKQPCSTYLNHLTARGPHAGRQAGRREESWSALADAGPAGLGGAPPPPRPRRLPRPIQEKETPQSKGLFLPSPHWTAEAHVAHTSPPVILLQLASTAVSPEAAARARRSRRRRPLGPPNPAASPRLPAWEADRWSAGRPPGQRARRSPGVPAPRDPRGRRARTFAAPAWAPFRPGPSLQRRAGAFGGGGPAGATSSAGLPPEHHGPRWPQPSCPSGGRWPESCGPSPPSASHSRRAGPGRGSSGPLGPSPVSGRPARAVSPAPAIVQPGGRPSAVTWWWL